MAQPQHPSPLWHTMLATVALTGTSFLAGMLMGRKGSWPFKRMAKEGPTKMALVVNGELKMGKGKVAAQCCHGALLAQREAQQEAPHLLQAWEGGGQAKVVLRAGSEKEMHEITEVALQKGVQAVWVKDAGRTQVAAGTLTVVAVGPARTSDVDEVTGHLKLL